MWQVIIAVNLVSDIFLMLYSELAIDRVQSEYRPKSDQPRYLVAHFGIVNIST